MIVADTGAILALIDRNDRHHKTMRAAFEDAPDRWILPWAILPEIDYLLGAHVSTRAQETFLADIASGAFAVAWGDDDVLAAAEEISRKHRDLRLGLVDAVVMATAERINASAIATLDLRHFAAVKFRRALKLLPRDLD